MTRTIAVVRSLCNVTVSIAVSIVMTNSVVMHGWLVVVNSVVVHGRLVVMNSGLVKMRRLRSVVMHSRSGLRHVTVSIEAIVLVIVATLVGHEQIRTIKYT